MPLKDLDIYGLLEFMRGEALVKGTRSCVSYQSTRRA